MKHTSAEQLEQPEAAKKEYTTPVLKFADVHDRTQKVPGTFESPTANS